MIHREGANRLSISIPVLLWWFEEDIDHRLLFLLIINSKRATKVINILCLKNVIQLSKRIEKRYIKLFNCKGRKQQTDCLQLYSRKIFTSDENNNFFLSNDIKYFVMTGGLHQCKNSKVTCQFNSILKLTHRLFSCQGIQRTLIS